MYIVCTCIDNTFGGQRGSPQHASIRQLPGITEFQLHVKSLYVTTVKVHTNLEDVLKLMVQAIQKNERIENDVSVSNKLRIIRYI